VLVYLPAGLELSGINNVTINTPEKLNITTINSGDKTINVAVAVDINTST